LPSPMAGWDVGPGYSQPIAHVSRIYRQLSYEGATDCVRKKDVYTTPAARVKSSGGLTVLSWRGCVMAERPPGT